MPVGLVKIYDESVQTSNTANVRLFNNGSWSAYNNPDDYYANYYTGIRAANYFLAQSVNYTALLATNRDTFSVANKLNYNNDVLNIGWLRAEAHILRAFYYFELSKSYGGVPLIEYKGRQSGIFMVKYFQWVITFLQQIQNQ